jgi:predicted transcriptional regulator
VIYKTNQTDDGIILEIMQRLQDIEKKIEKFQQKSEEYNKQYDDTIDTEKNDINNNEQDVLVKQQRQSVRASLHTANFNMEG